MGVLGFIFLLFVAVAMGCSLYVLGTYLLLAYDRKLAGQDYLEPGYSEAWDFPSPMQRWKGIVVEMVSTTVMGWTYVLGLIFPFYWKGKRNKGRPIILLHGFKCNQSIWILMRHWLKSAGLGPVYSLNLRPIRGPVEVFGDQIAKLADRIEKETGHSELILIGHSMGGLAAAYYAEHLAPKGKVTHCITLGSPLKGTRIASIAGSPVAKQMRQGSEFARELADRLMASSTQYFHIATTFDNLIYPYQSAMVIADPGHIRVLTWQGHITMAYSKTVGQQIVDWLRGRAAMPLDSAAVPA